ncbi:hypothetical protein DFH07DRAFT_967817 [Mycena maculata]|uniref:Uncharacterized protein n=1 Tax=Mycena maculata TaxID=230809 RepID=A0AAD7I4A9_9AGAR|nr:hypothetical protein DFH07DRAFT_967817 [Mycena maculata]
MERAPTVPLWSSYTISPRTQVIPLQMSFVDRLASQYVFIDRQRRNILAGESEKLEREGRNFEGRTTEPLSESSSSESDSEYTLPGGGYVRKPRVYNLCPRPRPALADITPIPETITADFLVEKLGFRRVRWEEPRVFADLEERIGAVFVGPPHQRQRWESSVRKANVVIRMARASIDHANLDTHNYLRGGITHDPTAKRPRRIDRCYTMHNIAALASLRNSRAVQDITSFQNAVLQGIAPRAWSDTRSIIDAVVQRDWDLHVPFQLGNQGPYQPTAFSEVEYRFDLPDSMGRRDEDDHPSSIRGLTAVGAYPYTEGGLILWNDRTVVDFPPGSSFFFLGALTHYSFCAVEKPGYQMIITQACGARLHGYVADGCEKRYTPHPEPEFPSRTAQKADRLARAGEAIGLLPTVTEWDAAEGQDLEDSILEFASFGV